MERPISYRLTFTHDFANGYPADETVEKLYAEIDFQRACQAYLWTLPAIRLLADVTMYAGGGVGNRDRFAR